jgi:glycerophosphoryl diester phosphodiesterase
LLGHRGARAVKSIRENTFASFDRALADGCDGFEFDVRLTADGQAVVCHDAEAEGLLIEATGADRLPQLARLADMLKRYQESAFLDIELKVPGLEKIVVKLLRTVPPRRGCLISSFLPEVIRALNAEDPALKLGLICEHRAELETWPQLPIDYLIPQDRLLTRELCIEIKAAGKKTMVWTVNDPAKMLGFHEMGVDGIISDNTSLLYATLGP